MARNRHIMGTHSYSKARKMSSGLWGTCKVVGAWLGEELTMFVDHL